MPFLRYALPSKTKPDSEDLGETISLPAKGINQTEIILPDAERKTTLTIENLKADLVNDKPLLKSEVELQGGIIAVNQSIVTEIVSTG